MSPLVLPRAVTAAGPAGLDHAAAVHSVVASAWHGLWHAAVSSPWIGIAVMVPAVGLLVGCTRMTVRRG